MAVADVAIKQELSLGEEEGIPAADPVNLEERILQLCSEHPKGITDEMIRTDQPAIDTAKRMKALQRLLSMVRCAETCLGVGVVTVSSTLACVFGKVWLFKW